ncbi:hypothetical protein SAMN02799616_04513 [Paenibacillus sp. UNC499MF]|nr:hypothetical protein SAMN02799616_04513 [Paenibacillus sp. UNC499MF]
MTGCLGKLRAVLMREGLYRICRLSFVCMVRPGIEAIQIIVKQGDEISAVLLY